MSNVLIEANQISKVYDPDVCLKRGKNEYALRSVDFILEEGDFISVMGPSGSGKSTLVNCLSTIDRITKGNLKIFDKNVLSASDNQLSEFRNKYLGFIFQNHNLIPSLTIFDNIAVPLLLNEVKNTKIEVKVKELSKKLGIEKVLDKRPDECSGGECQRAAIARALIHDPKIIICDEPTGNLDSRNSHEILKILTELNHNGTTVVLVTHDALIASYSKKLMYLYDGAIIEVIDRKEDSQIDYYHKILKITSKDSDIEKILSNNEYVELNPKMFKERIHVYMMLEDKEYDSKVVEQYRPLIMNHEYMIYKTLHHENVKIPFSIINKIVVDIDSSMVNFGFFGGIVYTAIIDFISHDNVFRFKVMNQDRFVEIIEHLKSLNIEIIDNKNILDAYYQYTDRMERNKYFQREFMYKKK